MQLNDFDYELPEKYIAHSPLDPRDHSKLMVIDRKTRTITHHHFYNLPDLLPADTVLVRNSSRVIKARLKGTLPTGGHVELFFSEPKGKKGGVFLVKPGRKFKDGSMVNVTINGESLQIQVRGELPTGERELVFLNLQSTLEDFLKKHGEIPLPPYIKQEDPNTFEKRYQTMYAKEEGSVAAPTAGLHFTPEVMKNLENKGIKALDVTLHVGLGTFLPVKTENVLEHHMHEERYHIEENIWKEILKAKEEHHPILSIGTTTTRVLEHVAVHPDNLTGATSIFIYPPYEFKIIDMLLTNFHLPKSTLLILISAFIGDREFALHAYEEAKKNDYRFFSFGDAMLII
ncbi:MAG: tRNA preQ1(34) S-adenosylmethionine ribosyltransferase-isomerase QueA [Candidatus Gracilibacteria bacterium]